MKKACRLINRLVTASTTAALLSTASSGRDVHIRSPVVAAKRPNIVVILADDLGYGDTSVYGSKIIRTPNIDALAASGTRFTSAYVTAPVCSPSRAGLMTGRYQQRFGYEFNTNGRDKTGGVSPNEITMAQILKRAGYRTGAIGKWHLGQPKAYYPTSRGFDYFFGIASGGTDYIIDPKPGDEYIGRHNKDIKIPPGGLASMPDGAKIKALLQWMRARRPITRNGKIVKVNGYLTTALTRQAVDFINRNQAKPFFLYFALHAPHVPLQAPKKYIDRYRNVSDPGKRVYAAMVSAVDDGVGDVISTLKRDKLYRNTLVIFLSDNGCAGYIHGACSNAPLSGFKRSLLEGGVRVPYIVSWPGHLPAGRVDGRQVSSLDILPTAAAVAHARLPTDRLYDGVDLVPYLNGTDNAVPNPKLYWREGTDTAIRDGKLKMWIANIAPKGARAGEGSEVKHANKGAQTRLMRPKKTILPTIGPQGQDVMLYNLVHDIGEKHNLAPKMPRKVKQLKAEIAHWNAGLIQPQWPTSKYAYIKHDGKILELFY